jgi:hypothetical protein
MKTLSKTLRFVVLAVIVTVVVVGCCNIPFPTVPGVISYIVNIGSQRRTRSDDGYVNWKSRKQFDDALKQLCAHGGTYCIAVKFDHTVIDPYHPEGSKDCTRCSWNNIRTVKITKFKAADKTAAGPSAANDPNVMHFVQSPYPGDITKVVDSLQLQ